VRCKARDQIIAGRMVHFSTSEWFHVCAEHAAQMSKPGMEIWEWECGAAANARSEPASGLPCRL
jgi:hypothetical protein